MKKVLFLLVCLVGLFGCNQSGVVSTNTVKKALDIAYTETKDFEMTGIYGVEFLFIKKYLKGQKYRDNMECSVLDLSDVEGSKHMRACLLKGVNADDSASTKDVLVMAEPFSMNKDIIVLMFFSDAKKTDKGFSYTTFLPVGIGVNLKTQKVGRL